MRVLLIEPNYKKSKNTYGGELPPLGLMKLSTFHKKRKDTVHFFKGTSTELHNRFSKKYHWRRIYITTDFSFQFKKTMETIKLAKKHAQIHNIFLGGVGATLLKDLYKNETGVNVIEGLLNKSGKLGLINDEKIDNLVPDYEILDDVNRKYQTKNAYIGYTTRGCVNHCAFCGVPKHEPTYCDYIDIKRYVKSIIKQVNEEKKDLILLDNNVLASKKFKKIIKDIKSLGFERDVKFNGRKKRYVDFNQGLDARLLNEKKAKLLSQIAIKPTRIAFDYIQLKEVYEEKISLMAKYDVLYLSNYLLYNYKDKPEDLYERIMINIRLNEELGTKIYSFPMKYIPLKDTDRSHIGSNWKKKELRAIQTILHATMGKVGPKREFNEKAFGKTLEEFKTLLWMPELYIMYRKKHERAGAQEWLDEYEALSDDEKRYLREIIGDNRINVSLLQQISTPRVRRIIHHYELLAQRAKRKAKIPLDQTFIYEHYQRQIAPSCC